MWADFHNLDHAFQRAHLRAAFLQLPRGAVDHLIGAPELRTVSENSVFLAVASWLKARVRDAAAEGPEGEAAAGADVVHLLRLVSVVVRVSACVCVLRGGACVCIWEGEVSHSCGSAHSKRRD